MEHTVRPRGYVHVADVRACHLAAKMEALRPPPISSHGARDCKQQVYERAASQAKRFGVQGSYVGLAAQYAPEIFNTYNGSIKGQMLNVEKEEERYEPLIPFTKVINHCFPYRKHKSRFSVCCDDILRALCHNGALFRQFSILDLDLMCHINKAGLLKDIATAVEVAAADRCQVLVWTAVGRNIKYDDYDQYGLELDNRLFVVPNSQFRLIDYSQDVYRDHRMPMIVERYILGRK